MMTDLAFTPAAELARLIARRELSPVELVDMVLARIEGAQPTLNAFITVTAEPARAAARAAEASLMQGEVLESLFGVPFSVKDLVNTAGVRTTFGSVALAGNVPAADSVAVARLKRAGAILIARRRPRNSGTSHSPRRRSSAAPPMPGTKAAPRAARAAVPRSRPPPVSARSRSAPTAADRAASRPPATVWSALSRPWV